MIKLVLSAIWICAIALGSSYVAASWQAQSTVGPADAAADGLTGLNYTKTDPINVPMILDGKVAGYVVAQFVYTADAAVQKRLSVPPDPFILDEAFRSIFGDASIDFTHLDRFDIAALTRKIREDVNARFGGPLVQDMLVQQFAFVSLDEVRAQEQGDGAGKGPVLSADQAVPDKR